MSGREAEAGAILAKRRAGPGRASLFLSLRLFPADWGGSANPFLGAAGKLGPSPWFLSVTEEGSGHSVLHKPVIQ